MFTSVLVANRGEIAVRVIRTLRSLGVRSVAVYSDADRNAPHVAMADQAIRLGPAPAASSYLDIDRVIEACRISGAGALHPGYGFLSENAALAVAVAAVGVTFVGPPPTAIEVMGDKINAKRAVAAAGVPVVPGYVPEAGAAPLDDEGLVAAALDVGLPVLLKPSAGGGGKGMRRVTDSGRLRAEIAAARREAKAAFGDDTLLVERWVQRPRHIEIQVFADRHGHCVHLGERECSLQRRHQKIVEEAPSVLLDEATRREMGASAVAAAQSVGYVGAGTVEFIVSADEPDHYFFMEMNTRLQVEHPVTELVTGLDLVEWQLRVAAGEPLGWSQSDIAISGHAVEVRVYAEDPAHGFLPQAGHVLGLREPTGRPGVRVDSGLALGSVVGTDYDPMLSKIVAYGTDRAEALGRLEGALAATSVLGVTTNLGFLRRLLAHPDVAAGRIDTGLVEAHLSELVAVTDGDEPLVVAGLALTERRQRRAGPDPWDAAGGWRIGEAVPAVWWLVPGSGGAAAAADVWTVAVTGPAADAVVQVGSGEPVAAAARSVDPGGLEVEVGGRATRWDVAFEGSTLWLGRGGDTWSFRLQDRHDADGSAVAGAGGPVTSPMPGTVLRVLVELGETVEAGQELAVVEAMKMEYAVTAPVAGTVTALPTRSGQQVSLGQALAEIDPGEHAEHP